MDGWFFKSGGHLPWHIKNLWVLQLFEQGLLASLAGFMVAGVVDSLVDAPRLGALLVMVLP